MQAANRAATCPNPFPLLLQTSVKCSLTSDQTIPQGHLSVDGKDWFEFGAHVTFYTILLKR